MSSSDDTVSKSKKRSAEKSGFRKAPGAPKRFKSPYILFSISRMDVFRNEMGSKTKVTSISKLVSDEWKALPTEERKKWEERARLDKERYNAEKSLYTGPWQVPSKRTRKDPSAPKRPMSAFLFYSQGKRAELKSENPELKNTEISRLLGERWKQAPESERLPFIEREKKVREVYNRDIAEWRKQKEEEEQAVRQHRQKVAEEWIKSGYQTHGSGMAAQVYAPTILASVNGAFVHLPQPPTQAGYPAIWPTPAPGMYITPIANNFQQTVSQPMTSFVMPQPGQTGTPATITPSVSPPHLPQPGAAPMAAPIQPTAPIAPAMLPCPGGPTIATPPAPSVLSAPTTHPCQEAPAITTASALPMPVAPGPHGHAPTALAPGTTSPQVIHMPIAQIPTASAHGTHNQVAPAPAVQTLAVRSPLANAPDAPGPIAPAPANFQFAFAPAPYRAPAPYTIAYAPDHGAPGTASAFAPAASIAAHSSVASVSPKLGPPSPTTALAPVVVAPAAPPVQTAPTFFNFNTDAFMIHQYEMQPYQYLASSPAT